MRNRNLLFTALALTAAGLIAVGCGGDDETTTTSDEPASALEGAETTAPEDLTIPENAEEALENAPENIDDAVQQCIDNAENSGLSGEQVDNLKQLCESGGDAANQALENAQEQAGG